MGRSLDSLECHGMLSQRASPTTSDMLTIVDWIKVAENITEISLLRCFRRRAQFPSMTDNVVVTLEKCTCELYLLHSWLIWCVTCPEVCVEAYTVVVIWWTIWWILSSLHLKRTYKMTWSGFVIAAYLDRRVESPLTELDHAALDAGTRAAINSSMSGH